MTSPLLERSGAVPAELPDAGVAAHYGDPLGEQRILANEGGLVDRSHRGMIVVRGPDRLSWLHSLTTQQLTALPPWEVTEGLVLSPRGHVENHFIAVDDGAATWLDVEPGSSAALFNFLHSMRFMLQVQVWDESDRWATLSLVGRGAPEAIRAATGVTLPEGMGARLLPEGGFVRRMRWPGKLAADLVVERARVESVVATFGMVVVGVSAFEALRIESRRPRLGMETDHRTIPNEVGWVDSAVHLNKGCYRGQETVARVHNLGKPPRRLALLRLASTEPLPAHLEPVVYEGRQVGFVGTPVIHHSLGPAALALMKRSVPSEAIVMVGGKPTQFEWAAR